jgi:hypothetical protein
MPKIYFGYIKYGWGWAFPKSDHMSIGLAGLFSKGANARDGLKNYLVTYLAMIVLRVPDQRWSNPFWLLCFSTL